MYQQLRKGIWGGAGHGGFLSNLMNKEVKSHLCIERPYHLGENGPFSSQCPRRTDPTSFPRGALAWEDTGGSCTNKATSRPLTA